MAPNPGQAKATCPECGSDQVTAHKRGYKVGRSLAASMTVLPVVGLGVGLIGRNKIQVTCINCGHSWIAGKAKPKAKEEKIKALPGEKSLFFDD